MVYVSSTAKTSVQGLTGGRDKRGRDAGDEERKKKKAVVQCAITERDGRELVVGLVWWRPARAARAIINLEPERTKTLATSGFRATRQSPCRRTSLLHAHTIHL
jgi:hypothetical protein